MGTKWTNTLAAPCSPAYIFDVDAFTHRCRRIKEALGDIPLTYSIKANPFLLNCIPKEIAHVEVCSPGELSICMAMHTPPESIIYSGVMKESHDIEQAVSYGAGILTAESIRHVELENQAVLKLGRAKKRVLLRLTSGNQFGMSAEDIKTIIANQNQYAGLEFYGIHHYSGTQKSLRQIKKDLQRLDKLLQDLKEEYDFESKLTEYGPGPGVSYFEAPYEEKDMQKLQEMAPELLAFAEKYPLGIEMGRFLAAPCGHYLTQIKDSKENNDTNYLICDGGIHHLKYHGQTLAMQVPPIRVCRQTDGRLPADKCLSADGCLPADLLPEQYSSARTEASSEQASVPYMICGSLCTVADVLVREVFLPPVKTGDYLLFGRCGAYSVTEGAALFLSRTMPQIYLYQKEKGYLLIRDFIGSAALNMAASDTANPSVAASHAANPNVAASGAAASDIADSGMEEVTVL